jgi:ureidoglycolate lyase
MSGEGESGGGSVARRVLSVEPLTKGAFAPYGQVIDTQGVTPIAINRGTALKFPDLATVELLDGGTPGTDQAAISIYRAEPRTLPLPIDELERHPLGSQAFVPIQPTRYLVVVAGSADEPQPGDLRAFLATGQQGVNLKAGVWHHALAALEREGEFLVVDRRAPGGNLDRLGTAAWRLAIPG